MQVLWCCTCNTNWFLPGELTQKASLHMLQFQYVENNVAHGFELSKFTHLYIHHSCLQSLESISPTIATICCMPSRPIHPKKNTKETMVKSSSTCTLQMCRVPNLCAGWVVCPTTFGDHQVIGNRVTGMHQLHGGNKRSCSWISIFGV